ncbi:MFS transporter [Glaciimonas soli]|uniref:MFS transporter n=1 Tax=Glaciimonas soli TaxID=2590999 RepID=A0A843YL92_9BURK|nr:MFS transporter [Glaciimonas soli]MQQ99699.1 MFS transporter [Glaciimonas soli]
MISQANSILPRSTEQTTKSGSMSKLVTGIVIGNALETFDFVVYGYFAVTLGKVFFPKENELAQLLFTLSIFGASYLMRPIGAIVLGSMADRFGRKKTLTLTLLLMALGTGMIAVLPSYNLVGIWAPLLMVLARLIQGFSAGGEIGTATTYLIESAPSARKGFYSSFQIVSQSLGFAFGSVLGSTLSLYLSESAFESWGWRVPFLIGVLIFPVGMYIRKNFTETLNIEERHTSSKALFGDLLGNNFWNLARCLMLCISGTVTVTMSIYMTTYAIRTLHLPMYVAMLTGLVGGAVSIIAAPLAGTLSDKIGRKPVILIGRVALVLCVLPGFWSIVTWPSYVTLFIVVAAIFLLNAISGTAELVFIPESLPAKVRGTGFSLAYSLTVAIFGGGAPLFTVWLVNATGNPLVPAWILIVTTLVSLSPLYFMRETVRHEN